MRSKILRSPLIVSDLLLELLVERSQVLRISAVPASWVGVDDGDGLRLQLDFLEVAAANRLWVDRHAKIGKFATADNLKLSSA